MAIVGRDLEYVEQVLGGPNYGEAALRGAGSGALVGALIARCKSSPATTEGNR